MNYRRVGTLATLVMVVLCGAFSFLVVVHQTGTPWTIWSARGSAGQFQSEAGRWPVPANIAELNRRRPLMPLNVRVVQRQPGLVKLGWDGTVSVKSYQVAYWHESRSGPEPIILPAAGIQLAMGVDKEAVIHRLPEKPGLVHRFSVRAVTEEGMSAWTSAIQVKALIDQPPVNVVQLRNPAPRAVSEGGPFERIAIGRTIIDLGIPQRLTGWYQTLETVVLDWQDVTGADSYQVRYLRDSRVASEWIVLPADGFRVSVKGSQALVVLPNGFEPTVEFSVRAISQEDISLWSEEVHVELNLAPPGGLDGRLHNDGRISLDWHDVELADTYEIRLLSDSGLEWLLLSEATDMGVTVDGSSASIEVPPNYNTFSFQFRSVAGDQIVISDWSETLVITRGPDTPSAGFGPASSGGNPASGTSPRPTATPGTSSGGNPASGTSPRPTATPGTSSGGNPASGTSPRPTVELAAVVEYIDEDDWKWELKDTSGNILPAGNILPKGEMWSFDMTVNGVSDKGKETLNVQVAILQDDNKGKGKVEISHDKSTDCTPTDANVGHQFRYGDIENLVLKACTAGAVTIQVTLILSSYIIYDQETPFTIE